MAEVKRKTRNNIFIIGGLLLFVAGLLGNYYSTRGGDNNFTKSIFRYVSKTEPNVIVPLIGQSVEKNPLPIVIKDQGIKENQFSYFIVSKQNPELNHPKIPDRIEIPSVKLNAPVKVADFNFTKLEGETFGQWVAPYEFAAGWHPNSALLGKNGNTVINGHHNAFGDVFGKLVDVKVGDLIYVYSGNEKFTFQVANRMILPERFADPKTRLENARWLGKSEDMRLTLVTCWPAKSNTHRLILVARPVNLQ